MADGELKFALKNISEFQLPENGDGVNDFELLTGWFRTLRNYCASGRHAQVTVAQHPDILQTTKRITGFLIENNKADLCLLICLQFVANYLVDNKQHQCQVWQEFSYELQQALRYKEPKIQNCAAMILYNVFLDNDHLISSFEDPLKSVIELTQNEVTSEYAAFILELFICKTNYIEKHFGSLPIDNRLILLHVCESILKSPERRSFPAGLTLYLAKYFIDKSLSVLRTASENTELAGATEIALVLDVINSLAGFQNSYLLEIQSCGDLMIHSINLLKAVHAISKERGNNFSMLLKISDLEEAEENSALQEHPAFGFKAGLVRLIGNMCWHHKGHQDTAREMDAIPLILDCSNIDARNPLIIQWAVLAMRNLCEGNLENQRVVACVDRAGQVDSSRLADLGMYQNGSHS